MRAWLVAFAVVAVAVSGCVTQDEPTEAPDLFQGPSTTTGPGPQPEPEPGPEPEPESPTNETPQPTDNDTEDPEPEPEPEPGPKPVWGDPETAPIYPGVYTGCTTNFLFTSPDYRHIYIGSAAHCFGAVDVDPCDDTTSMPPAPGQEVPFYEEIPYPFAPSMRQNLTGTLAYNSFYTQRVLLNETDAPECTRLNDFALVEIPLDAQGLVTPVWRHFNVAATHILGPEEINVGDPVIGYGHSHYWLGTEPLYPKHGVVTGEAPHHRGGHWQLQASLVPVGIFGDSGSPVMTLDGGAVGVIKTLGTVYHGGLEEPTYIPTAGTNGVVTLHTALSYMETHTGLPVQLAEA